MPRNKHESDRKVSREGSLPTPGRPKRSRGRPRKVKGLGLIARVMQRKRGRPFTTDVDFTIILIRCIRRLNAEGMARGDPPESEGGTYEKWFRPRLADLWKLGVNDRRITDAVKRARRHYFNSKAACLKLLGERELERKINFPPFFHPPRHWKMASDA